MYLPWRLKDKAQASERQLGSSSGGVHLNSDQSSHVLVIYIPALLLSQRLQSINISFSWRKSTLKSCIEELLPYGTTKHFAFFSSDIPPLSCTAFFIWCIEMPRNAVILLSYYKTRLASAFPPTQLLTVPRQDMMHAKGIQNFSLPQIFLYQNPPHHALQLTPPPVYKGVFSTSHTAKQPKAWNATQGTQNARGHTRSMIKVRNCTSASQFPNWGFNTCI